MNDKGERGRIRWLTWRKRRTGEKCREETLKNVEKVPSKKQNGKEKYLNIKNVLGGEL
jgi:hypothetical protein